MKYRAKGRFQASDETLEDIIEALIHQIIAIDGDIKVLIERLWLEMKRSKYPLTTKDEWHIFQMMNVEND